MLHSQTVTIPLRPPRWRRFVDSPAVPAALLTLFAGLIIATITRFSSWIDESATLLLVGPNSYTEILRRTAVDVHPPLWYWVLKLWLQVFGNSILASRAESAVFMIAALGIWYHLVRTRFSRPLAVVSLALMVTNPTLLHYAIEGRMYAFGTLLVAVTCLLITGRWRWRWFAYWPCAVAMLYTHYFLAFPIAAQFVYLILCRREQGLWLPWIVIYGASIIVGFAPWIPHAIRQTSSIVSGSFWIGPVTPTTILGYVELAFLHRGDRDLSGAKVFPGLLYFAVWAAALIRAGRARGGPYVVLWCLISVPWVCLFALSCPPLRPVFDPRYVMFGLGGLLTLLAAGALGCTGRWRPFAIAVLLAGHVWGLTMLYHRGFSETRGFFAMKKIAAEVSQPVDGELPWVVSTWVFGFYDARATLAENQRVLLLTGGKPTANDRDTVLYYDRPDWYTASLSNIHARHVWLMEQINGPLVDVPPNWDLVVSHRRGYARTRLFTISSP